MRAFPLVLVAACSFVLLPAGCSHKSPRRDAGPLHPAALLEQAVEREGAADIKRDRMLIWTASLGLEVADVDDSLGKIVALAGQQGGYVESKSESAGGSADLRLRVPVPRFKETMASLETLGDMAYRRVRGEDVTEQYIDVEARLKNKIALRDRLRQLLEKATAVKDILSIESELSRVQGDIDSMEGRLQSMKGQADLATVDVNVKRKPVLGPLGYLFKGLWWGIKKLFVIRE